MAKNPKEPIRSVKTRQDLGSIPAIQYIDASGSQKISIIDPPIKRAVGAGEAVGPGKYVKITGTTYTLDLLNKAYDPAKIYKIGDVVSESTDIYMCTQDNATGTFDVSQWQLVAPKQIASIPVTAGTTVTTGRWHNSVTVAGFLVDDETQISHGRSRD